MDTVGPVPPKYFMYGTVTEAVFGNGGVSYNHFSLWEHDTVTIIARYSDTI